MNVDRSGFIEHLPTILKHVSNSHFISFDLELSGIPAQRRRDVDGKQNLQERYQGLKRAAERFHILQVGLTCIEQDAGKQTYLIRPYNFNISPLIGHGIDVEREFTYSTGAVDFLLNHGYEMDAPYRLGVPYLTRSEAKQAEERAKMRWDKGAIPDIKVDPSDKQALAFMQHVRESIDAWRMSSKQNNVPCSVGGSTAASEDPDLKPPLNRFERRLVHQLVRAEYPMLCTSSKGDYVQVFAKNEREQTNHQNSLERRFTDSIFLQTGFRWISDALIGNDLSGTIPNLRSPRAVEESDSPIPKQFPQQLVELSKVIKSRKRVLVGHNCFLDLVYFYSAFIGDLPATLEGFQESIHEVFPLIIDTKYMATATPGGGAFRSSQLWQIDEALSDVEAPKFDTPSDHPSYVNFEQYHEAGYDSFATAKVFLRLCALLEAAGKSKGTNEPAPDGEPIFQNPAGGRISNAGKMPSKDAADPAIGNVAAGDQTDRENRKSRRKAKPDSLAKGGGANKFFSANVFENLRDVPDSDDVPLPAETPVSSSNAKAPNSRSIEVDRMKLPIITSPKYERTEKLLPPWDSSFWKIYGNKLRVYGTVEEICDLSERPSATSEEIEDRTSPSGGVLGSERRSSLLESLVDKCKNLLI